MVSPADEGSPAVTLGAQWPRCLEAARAMCRCYDLSRHRLTPSRTPTRSCAASLPNTPSTIRRPNFTQPQAVVGKRHPMSSSRMSRRVPRVARRGSSSAARRPQPWSMTTVASTSKQTTPLWCTLWLSQLAVSVRHDCPWTTLRSTLRRLARTTPTPSTTSLGTMA
jgi:hypothetical protein